MVEAIAVIVWSGVRHKDNHVQAAFGSCYIVGNAL